MALLPTAVNIFRKYLDTLVDPCKRSFSCCLQKAIIHHLNFLYSWQGSHPGLKSILLAAHQDVVPAECPLVGRP